MRSSSDSLRPTGTTDGDKVATGLSERAVAGIGSWSDSAHRAVDLVAGTMSSAARQVGDKSHDWLEAQHRWTEASRETVRRHPIASVAIALAAGVLLSRLSSGFGEH